jgi:photosystem II stability/assembly factor-like uncharacterized protein
MRHFLKIYTSAILLAAVCWPLADVEAQTGWNVVRKGTAGDLIAVYFVDANKGWIGGDAGYLGQTKDGGGTWTRQNLNTSGNVNDIYFRAPDIGYVLAGSKIFITNDGGVSWREVKAFAPSEFLGSVPEFYSIRFADKKKGWIVGSVSRGDEIVDSLVLRTEDGGSSWKRVRVPTTEELFHLDFANESRGWIVGSSGVILATENGGESWQTQRSGTVSGLFNVDFRNAKDGWAVGESGIIIRTEDGGKTWLRSFPNFKNTFLRVNAVDDKSIWVAGRGGLILRSDDKGKSWIKQDSRTTENLFGLYMDKKTGWAVGGKGIVLKYVR